MRIARKCSYCGNLGHNARTCKNVSHGQLKLFGVQLDVYSSSSSSNSFSSSSPSYSATKTSFSTNYLLSSSESLSSPYPSPSLFGTNEDSDSYSISAEDGLLSTILDSKKGEAWTEEEHRVFLIGLEKLGKGNWRGISRSYVTTRTPTQVASHAQKYFLRQSRNSSNTRKHRPSLFHVGMKVKPHSIESQLTRNGMFVSECLWHCHSTWTSTNCSIESAPPDLELKLATPAPLDQHIHTCPAPGHLS